MVGVEGVTHYLGCYKEGRATSVAPVPNHPYQSSL